MHARLLALGAVIATGIAMPGAQSRLTIDAVSTRAHLVTGGDLLVRITGPAAVKDLKVRFAGSRELPDHRPGVLRTMAATVRLPDRRLHAP
jgi:hypothetical protein